VQLTAQEEAYGDNTRAAIQQVLTDLQRLFWRTPPTTNCYAPVARVKKRKETEKKEIIFAEQLKPARIRITQRRPKVQPPGEAKRSPLQDGASRRSCVHIDRGVQFQRRTEERSIRKRARGCPLALVAKRLAISAYLVADPRFIFPSIISTPPFSSSSARFTSRLPFLVRSAFLYARSVLVHAAVPPSPYPRLK